VTISREIDEFTKVVKKELLPVAKVIAAAFVVEAVLLLVLVILGAVIAARAKR
jgi:hypothetical protein